jgi:hypothetical protein
LRHLHTLQEEQQQVLNGTFLTLLKTAVSLKQTFYRRFTSTLSSYLFTQRGILKSFRKRTWDSVEILPNRFDLELIPGF